MLVEAVDLVKSFGRVQALKGVSFRIPAKSVTGLIGPNGAGKTTTIKIMIGHLRPDYGEIRVLGMDPWRDGYRLRRHIGYLPENPQPPSNVSCRKLLEFYARMKGVSDIRGEVKRVSILTGISKFLDRKVGSLSRGMLQRLMLALALLGNPSLVILDEPLTHIDPATRSRILELIRSIHDDEKIDFIVSTHILAELEQICNHIIIINRGYIVDQGNVKDICSRYDETLEYIIEIPRKSDLEALKRRLLEHDFIKGFDVTEPGKTMRVLVSGRMYGGFEKLASEMGLRIIDARFHKLISLYKRLVGEHVEAS